MCTNRRDEILIADDHPLFRGALILAVRDILSDATILEASNFAALETMTASHAGLTLVSLDLNMPGALGFSSLVYLRSMYPALPVVVISASDDPRMVRKAQQFGAAAFVSKSSPMTDIQHALREVMEGGEWFPVSRAIKSEADTRLAKQLAQLTPQQLRVLMYVSEGLQNKEIAYRLDVAENTVKIHVTAIFRKLDCHSRTQLAVLVRQLDMNESI